VDVRVVCGSLRNPAGIVQGAILVMEADEG
jgi:hypothetical protein